MTGRCEPERIEVSRVTANLFSTLGVTAEVGRTLTPGEGQPGREAVVLLSHGLWERRFGAQRDIIGETLTLDGVGHTVVGVMPADFWFPSNEVEVWVPASFDASNVNTYWGFWTLHVVGRLLPGVSVELARTEVDALMSEVRAAFPWKMPDDWGRDATIVPLQESLVGDVRPMLFILLGAVAFVLLIACVNVVNLLLVRTAERRREMVVRTALGAHRGRLVRQYFAESTLFALLAGGVGVVFAFSGVRSLVSVLPAMVPRTGEIGLDPSVLGFAIALAALVAPLIGLVPAFRASRTEAGEMLREGGRFGAGRKDQRASAVLVVIEIALAVVLVAGAGLLTRSFARMMSVDPGFTTERLIAATVAPPEFRYTDDPARRVFFGELLSRVEESPGIRAAAVSRGLPFAGGTFGGVFLIEGRADPATTGDWPLTDAHMVVSPTYFRVMTVALLEGRGFTEADRADGPGVAIVSRGLAEQYWPDENVIGKRMKLLGDESWRTIVGVAEDVAWQSLTAERGTGLYVPLCQGPTGPMRVVVRTTSDPHAFAANLRALVTSIDDDTPVSDVRT
ncbi:MAG: ABC transporter permease, partial [Longimicrobiales bacterium]